MHGRHARLTGERGFDPPMGHPPDGAPGPGQDQAALADELLFGKPVGDGRVSIDVKVDELVVDAQSSPGGCCRYRLMVAGKHVARHRRDESA